MRPLGEYLREHIPRTKFSPGVTPAYSNYATAPWRAISSAHLWKAFEQYVADNIYTPLGMNHTTFVQPLPPNLSPLMSNGYQRASKEAKPYEFGASISRRSVATSAADMCKIFMMAHLQGWPVECSRILSQKPQN